MVLLLLRTTPCVAQTTPTIANVTNAALPTIDLPVQPNVHVAPRSMVSIYGSGLSTAAAQRLRPGSRHLAECSMTRDLTRLADRDSFMLTA